MTIAVIMPHLPRADREEFYREAVASVRKQLRQPDEFIIEPDPEKTGAAATLNRALPKVTSEWIAQLGDDDLFLPEHLQVLESELDGSDVLYPDCIQRGAFYSSIGGEYRPSRLTYANFIPGGGSLIRTAAARAVDGWCKRGDPDWHLCEDWIMWKRLRDAGYTFKHVRRETWIYRFHPSQTGGQG